MRIYSTTTNPTAPIVRDIEGACCDVVQCTKFSSDVGPNITGELGPALAQNSGTITNLVSGAISIDRSNDGTDWIGGSHWSAKGLAFSASQSNSVYGLSSKVQPQSILVLPCIKT